MSRTRVVFEIIRWVVKPILNGIHDRCFTYDIQYSIIERRKGLLYETVAIEFYGSDQGIAKVIEQTFPDRKDILINDIPEKELQAVS